jgi:hypothetical protein
VWIATNEGWISVVKRRGTDELLVRARSEEHLLWVLIRLQPEHVKADVDKDRMFVDLDADYPYRMYVTREEFKRYLDTQINRIDYDNFKARVPDKHYAHALNDVWYTMYQWGIPHRPINEYTTLDDFGMVYDNERIAYEEE